MFSQWLGGSDDLPAGTKSVADLPRTHYQLIPVDATSFQRPSCSCTSAPDPTSLEVA